MKMKLSSFSLVLFLVSLVRCQTTDYYDYTTGTGTGTGGTGTSDYPTTTTEDITTTENIPTTTKVTTQSQTTLQSASPTLSVVELLLLLPIILQYLFPLIHQTQGTASEEASSSLMNIPIVPQYSGSSGSVYSEQFQMLPPYTNSLFPYQRSSNYFSKSKKEKKFLSRAPIGISRLIRVSSSKPDPMKIGNRSAKTKKGKKTVKKIQKKRKVSIYKRLPIPGTSKYVTVKSGDLYKSVDIFYDHRKFNIRTADIMKMKTVPDIIRTLKVYKIG